MIHLYRIINNDLGGLIVSANSGYPSGPGDLNPFNPFHLGNHIRSAMNICKGV